MIFSEMTVLTPKKSNAGPNSGPAPIVLKQVAPLGMGRYGAKLSVMLTPGYIGLHR
jgi:hypothetical protein